MNIQKITLTASGFESERALPRKFLDRLQEILDNGEQVVTVTRDEVRVKEAFVIIFKNPVDSL